jgi:hypothetical protein
MAVPAQPLNSNEARRKLCSIKRFIDLLLLVWQTAPNFLSPTRSSPHMSSVMIRVEAERSTPSTVK